MPKAYVGAPLPREVKAVLTKAQGGLHAGRPVPEAALHLSLAELGEIDEQRLGEVREKLELVEGGPFFVALDGLGTRGGIAPDTLHVEADLPRGLREVQKLVVRAVRLAGVDLPVTRYAPHVALARFDAMGAHDLKQIMSFLSRRAALSTGPFPVTDIELYAEDDGPGGPTWEVVAAYPLDRR